MGVSVGGLKSVARDNVSFCWAVVVVTVGFIITLSSFPFCSSISIAFREFSCPDWYLSRWDKLQQSLGDSGQHPHTPPAPPALGTTLAAAL